MPRWVEATPCKQAFSDFTTAMGAADSFLVFARQLVTEFNNGQYTAVCVDVRDKLGLDPTFDCSDGPNAKARAEQLANFVVNKYLNLGQALSTARSFALQKAAAAAAQVSTPSDVGIGSDFSELGLDQSIPIGPIAVEIAVSLYGNWFLKGGIAPTLSLGAQGQGDPQIGASAHVTPGISVSASVYVGVGIDLGVAGATVGLEGTLLLVDADAPITASVTAKRTTVAETSVLPGHDYRTSDFGGTQIAGLPAGNAYKWVGAAGLGAAFGLASLNGHIDAAARVHFLFFSKTFRKQIASFTGFPKQYFPIFSVGGAVPLPSPSPQLFPDNLAITGTPDFGVFGETAAYPQIALVGGGSIGTLPSNASSTVICPIVVP